jgi:oxygen-dependent protoporphyrinogen oxidase
MSQTIAVIGAGISGLAAAHRLRALQPGLDIVVYERSSRAGGIIQTEHVDGFTIEGGPDSFLATKEGGIQFARELGLEQRLVGTIPANKGSYVLRNGKLQPIPQGLTGLVPGELRPMFQSPLISPLGKLRMLADLVIRPRQGSEDESVAAFVRRRVGVELYDHMIEPLLTGIYAGDGDQLSLAATFPQLRAAELSHGGLLRGAFAQKRERRAHKAGATPRSGFLSFDTGMGILVDHALHQARESGTQFEFNATCTAIETCPEGEFALTVDGPAGVSTVRVAGVILAVPGWVAGPLLSNVAPEASAALGELEYSSSALVAVGFPESQLTRPMAGYGYVVPRVEHRDVMAMTWLSSKWAGRAPEGQTLVRAFFGRKGQDSSLQLSDDELVDATRREIRQVLGADVTPTITRVYRIDRGMPQYTMGHLDRVDAIERALAQMPGLQLTGNMLRGVGIPDCIQHGQRAATNLLADLSLVQG